MLADHACRALVYNFPNTKILQALEILGNTSLWPTVLRIATPLIIGALGAFLCARVGVLILRVEGIMTMGAMPGWLMVFKGGDLWIGRAVAAYQGL